MDFDQEWYAFRSDVFPDNWKSPKFRPYWQRVWKGYTVTIQMIKNYSLSVIIEKDGEGAVPDLQLANLNGAMFIAFKEVTLLTVDSDNLAAFKAWFNTKKADIPWTNEEVKYGH